MTTTKNVLIVGASGIVGKSAVEEFINASWNVYGVSRRFPEILSETHTALFHHTPLDLTDKTACERVLSGFGHITHVVYTALIDHNTSLSESWRDEENCSANQAIFENCFSVLLRVCKNLEHVGWLQGTGKAYAAHYRPILVPARERDPRDPANTPNWYWTQEDWIRQRLSATRIRWTIYIPCCIWGDALGKPMTCTKALPLYTIIQKHLGKPLAFPVVERDAYVQHVDGRLLARCLIWGATSPAAHGERFNIDNGDVWQFRSLWNVLSRYYDVPVAEDQKYTLERFFDTHEDTWQDIVQKHGLRNYTLRELLGQSAQSVDILMNNSPNTQRIGGPNCDPWIESRIKLTLAGFTECIDTEDMAIHYFQRMEKERILPKSSEIGKQT